VIWKGGRNSRLKVLIEYQDAQGELPLEKPKPTIIQGGKAA
jgi:hypothetical protein